MARAASNSLAGHFEKLRGDYAATKASRYRRRRTGLAAGGAAADYHYRNDGDYLKLIELARDMDRNDQVVSHFVNRAVQCTLNGGRFPDPNTGDDKLNAEISERWQEWSEDPQAFDVQGENDFQASEELVFRSVLVDGDVMPIPLESGHVQFMEGHRLRTPYGREKGVVHGVEMNGVRRRLRYHFTLEDIDPAHALSKTSEMQAPVDAYDDEGHRQVFHVYNPRRFSQTRGVSAMAPIVDTLGMFEDTQFATMVQRQIVSCIAFFTKREAGWKGPQSAPLGATTEETRSDGSKELVEEMKPGMHVKGGPGEEITGFSPQVPGADYFPHVRLILTIIGCNFGLPLCVALLDASDTNFSGFRGAIEQAKLGWKSNIRSLDLRYNKPLYRWKLRQWMAEDSRFNKRMSRSSIRPFRHNWNTPSWPYIEPLTDAQSSLLRMRGGLSSPRRIHAEQGEDVDQISREQVADNAYRIRLAKAEAASINKDYPDGQPVHWRDLLSLPMPEGMTLNLAAAPTTTPAQKEGKADGQPKQN